MAIINMTMPKMGESIMEATILHWHKKPGDIVKADETVLEIATDKVDSEVPSIVDGKIVYILFNENDVVPVGAVIATIEVSGDQVAGTDGDQDEESFLLPDEEDEPEPAAASVQEPAPEPPVPETPASAPTSAAAGTSAPGRFYSPLVLTIARNEGVSMTELEQMPGSGMDGRVTKKDILQYVAARRNAPSAGASRPYTAPAEAAAENGGAVAPVTGREYAGNVEIIEMDRMRRMIAEHMISSKQTSAHVTSFSEADVTHLVNWRNRVKKDFETREGEKLTLTPLFMEAIIKCIKKFPLINSSVDGTRIIVKKDINLGMATALPGGSLIVPVIRNAETLNLVGLARKVNQLAAAARSGKLQPDEVRDGTFTVTNVGTFGSLAGTPIINQPQVAILAVGAIKKRPVVVESPLGDSIAIRHMMYLSMSYDHRIVDGSLGATFLTAVAQELEQFDPARTL
jgi:2-oxoglutarate dehydrogenase E2 component (dihydrolipoamide succinyltransferase)